MASFWGARDAWSSKLYRTQKYQGSLLSVRGDTTNGIQNPPDTSELNLEEYM